MLAALSRPFRALNAAVESGAVKAVFDHIRNYLYSSLFFAAGSYAASETSSALLGIVRSSHLGWGVMAIGAILWAINFYEGLYRLTRRNHAVLYAIFFSLLYVLASIRIVEVIWQFRLGEG